MKIGFFIVNIINSIFIVLFILVIKNFSFLKNNFEDYLYNNGFKVKKIYINQLDFLDITNVIDSLDFAHDTPIINLDIVKNKNSLEDNFWINKADISIVYPDLVNIKIDEKKPEFLWYHNMQYFVLDKKGKVLKKLNISELKKLSNFIMLDGNNARLVTDNLLSFIKLDNNIYLSISKAIWVGNRRWDIEFINGFRLQLPQKDPMQAWKYFIKLNQHIDFIGNNIESLDLRLPERLFMKLNLDDPLNKNLLNIL